MSRTISLREASRSLRELMTLASRGEEVIIAAEDGAAARLVPYPTSGTKRRVFGKYRGKIRIHEDFDDTLLAQERKEEPRESLDEVKRKILGAPARD